MKHRSGKRPRLSTGGIYRCGALCGHRRRPALPRVPTRAHRQHHVVRMRSMRLSNAAAREGLPNPPKARCAEPTPAKLSRHTRYRR